MISPRMKLVGFTIGNDVSARDIEGENPLYLPQAKVYNSCCALGPAITLSSAMPDVAETDISVAIDRGGRTIWEGATSARRMVRSFAELIDWLGRDHSFPEGAILLTGTGVVPPGRDQPSGRRPGPDHDHRHRHSEQSRCRGTGD